ncbi:hypothetical protein SB766_25180, partial [Pseudomonas sp. SIMBA_077]
LLLVGAKLGMDVRICAPKALWPHDDLVQRCKKYAEESGARITLTEDPKAAVKGVDRATSEQMSELVTELRQHGDRQSAEISAAADRTVWLGIL